MHTWTLFLLYLLEVNCDSSDTSESYYYECGPHGRFEYCINGIPGCVIGCHCHPGYYFDTESKICEPNVKLTQNYRRQFMQEPTRSPISVPTMATKPTLTTINPIEAKVDAITKDNDDLGDWLYNQFFKTIENQVINSTDNDQLTRRSGSQFAKPIPTSMRTRRSRKKGNRRLKTKKILKKKGLRRKLLRITEDDSLFDDSSSLSSSDSSSYSSSSSDTSSEDDDEHGHRKILMINKKPTPPLPSFIFLPNVETPFYPPIGLPPPPVMPMYPMVPVPPVGPYFTGYHQVPCNDSETTSTTTQPQPPTTTPNGVKTTEASTTVTPSSNNDPNPDYADGQPVVRARTSKGRNKKSQKSNKNKEAERNKMIKKMLLEKMMRRNKQGPLMPFAEQDPEMAYMNDFDPPRGPMAFARNMYSSPAPMEDVNFKYLSQLIHKIDLNNTNPAMSFKLKPTIPDLPNRPFRRTYMSNPPMRDESPQKLRPASKADDDAYYTNLGRQIASLIRKVDTDGERLINIEIEQQSPSEQAADPTIFDENRYAPRSYWERFVRSPLQPKQSYIEEINHLKSSNENLFNIENQVSVATAVERALSLHELENIANIMERAQLQSAQKSSKYVTPGPSSRSYNINLLPRLNRRANAVIQVNTKNKLQNPVVDYNINRHVISTTPQSIHPTRKPQDIAKMRQYTNHAQRNLTLEDRKNLDYFSNILKSPHKRPLDQQVPKILYKNVTSPNTISAQQATKYQLNPMMLNYKSLKYVGNKHNKYPTQHSYMPFQMPFFSKLSPSTGRMTRPSYYHHEMHHFDFFD